MSELQEEGLVVLAVEVKSSSAGDWPTASFVSAITCRWRRVLMGRAFSCFQLREHGLDTNHLT